MNTNNFSKECFYDALISLYKENDFCSINVKQICKKAGYNRSTSYRHYTSKEDIILQKIKALVYNWHSSLNNEIGYEFENFVNLFDYFRTNSEAFVIMHKMNLDDELLLLSREYLYNNFEVEEYDSVFINNGILAVVFSWIDNGMKESNEYMAKLLSKYLNYGNVISKKD